MGLGKREVKPDRLRRRVLSRLINHPPTLMLAAGGVTAMLAQWAMAPDHRWFLVGGAFALLTATGVALSRLVLATGQIADEALAVEQKVVAQEQTEAVQDLRARLVKDNDSRTQKALDRLLDAHRRIEQRLNSAESPTLAMVLGSMDDLYHGSLRALEQSLRIAEDIGACASFDERKRLRAKREQLISDICDSVSHLEARIDELPEPSTKSSESQVDLVALRNQIDKDLDLSSKVEERLSDLESEAHRQVEAHKFMPAEPTPVQPVPVVPESAPAPAKPVVSTPEPEPTAPKQKASVVPSAPTAPQQTPSAAPSAPAARTSAPEPEAAPVSAATPESAPAIVPLEPLAPPPLEVPPIEPSKATVDAAVNDKLLGIAAALDRFDDRLDATIDDEADQVDDQQTTDTNNPKPRRTKRERDEDGMLTDEAFDRFLNDID